MSGAYNSVRQYTMPSEYVRDKNVNPNEVFGDVSVFPNRIYDRPLFPSNLYECDGTPGQAFTYASRPRNLNVQYIIGSERLEHPPWFTRFGRGFAPNGYGEGNQSIFKYVRPEQCPVPMVTGFCPPSLDNDYYRGYTSQGYRQMQQGKNLSTDPAFLTPLKLGVGRV